MNIGLPAIANDHRLALDCEAASIWRGRFVEEFALAETAASEALASIASVPWWGSQMVLPHLVGQRFEYLKSLVASRGPFASEGQAVARLLAGWSELHQLRAFLCHGSGTVTISHDGRWHIALHLLNFRGGKPQRETMALSEDEAGVILGQLRSARVRLEGQIAGMLAALRAAPLSSHCIGRSRTLLLE